MVLTVDKTSNIMIDLDSTPVEDRKYIFIRLYYAHYKKSALLVSIVKPFIMNLKEGKDGHKYTHSAISTKLTDDFIGLTSGGKYCAKIEKCHNNDPKVCPHLSEYDELNSKFSVFALPVTTKEFNDIKATLERALTDTKLSYSLNALLKYGNFDETSEKIDDGTSMTTVELRNLSPDKKADMIISYLQREKIVCSTFIIKLLMKCVRSIRKDISRKEADSTYVSPSALTFIPGLIELVEFKTFCDYDKEMSNFVSEHPQFKEYYK